MPYWVLAQCDPYHSARSKAQNSFKTAFSEQKQPEVLNFSKTEIINVITINRLMLFLIKFYNYRQFTVILLWRLLRAYVTLSKIKKNI